MWGRESDTRTDTLKRLLNVSGGSFPVPWLLLRTVWVVRYWLRAYHVNRAQLLHQFRTGRHIKLNRMTSNQIEAARVAINRHLKRKGKVWIRVFPHKPVTKKPAETRQGKGKGPVDHWVAVIKPGHVLFEIAGCSLTLAREALGLADAKLPFRCRLVTRERSF